jgi:hypothetical protein
MAAMPKRKIGSRFTSGHLLMIVCGLIAFLLAIIVLGGKSKTVTVYVAKDDIVAGRVLTTSMFTATEVKSSTLDPTFILSGELKSGKSYSAKSISKGEALTHGDVTPSASKNNARVMSIPISQTLAVNGDLKKGDRVDIIATPEDECAYRALSNVEIFETPSKSGGGALSGGSNSFVLKVTLSHPGDDLTLATVIAGEKYQVVKSTGSKSSVDSLESCDGPSGE